jgi:RNA polymerase sigma-70 factor (ECF subfamily)
MDEREALERMRRGDIAGLEVLVRAHQVRAIRTAYLVTRDVALAQDVVQSAFLRAYERIRQLDPVRPFAPWFLASVLHDAIKAVSRRDPHGSLEESPSMEATIADVQPQPDDIWEHAETADEIWTALGNLSPDQRAAVVARYYLGLNQAEMTRALRCSPSTVKWRLHSARARLRLLLTPLLSND